jgi:type I restriction enzyme S subunit
MIRETKLGFHIETLKGFAFKSTWYVDEGRPIVKVSDFTDESINTAGLVCIPEDIAKEFLKYELREKDVLIQTVGSWPNNPKSVVGKVVRVPSDVTRALLNQNAVRLTAINDMDNNYLYFLLRSPEFKKYIINTAQGAANQAAITLESIKRFTFKLPEVNTQRKISSILSTYDDLIENNLKRIKILEEMVQMIYREWFVNFRFPGHEKVKMVKSELGMIPEGWEIIKLGEMLEFQKGKKATNIYHQPLNNSIPYLLIDGLRNRSFLYTDDKTMPIAKKDNILMVMDGASSGQVFIGFEGAVGSTIGIYRIKDTNNLFSYLVYFFLKNNFKTISEKNIGSAIPHANKDFIASMKIVTPKSNIVILFSDFVSDIFKQIDVLERKTLNLRKTRDLLLPKLISGEIDIENVDFDIEAA